METITLSKGLDLPIAGAPRPQIAAGPPINHVALVGEDYPGLRPSLAVREGELVAAGQLLFTDKKNPGVAFTAPAAGRVAAINRGERRRFLSLVIRLEGDQQRGFPVNTAGNRAGENQDQSFDPEKVKKILLDSGLWTAIRTRPFGKVASPASRPASLFVTAMDTRPLAADPLPIINRAPDDFRLGLQVLQALVNKIFLIAAADKKLPGDELPGLTPVRFAGPHPAGLPSTHIHFLDPVGAGKQVWQIGYQDVLAIGYLFRHGRLPAEQVVALTGPGMKNPRLLLTRRGAALAELCAGECNGEWQPEPPAPNAPAAELAAEPAADRQQLRLLSGSVLDGRRVAGPLAYLGRYHDQICALPDRPGSGPFNWLRLGGDRFSAVPAFLAAVGKFIPPGGLAMTTALWGGRRAIFPLGTYERVMPLDLVATALLKAIAVGNSERAEELGALELVEEDLALCSYVCPGKNDFGPLLREVLTNIELEG